eukprot:GHVL01024725.1.p1 GENE.GHVL01024725.1~~GHVL01024725.1.p1  ORF type:complete len:216 (+),score=19.90 GHVL01024725.1:74-721(+)
MQQQLIRTSHCESETKLDSDEDDDRLRRIVVELPDGSLAEAVPPGWKDPIVTSPRFARESTDNLDELTFVYSCHQKIFITLLLMQAVVEAGFHFMFISYAKYVFKEISDVYPTFQYDQLMIIGSILLMTDIIYCIIFYTIGLVSVYSNRIRLYDAFSQFAILGVLVQLLLAYIGKFNFLIFLLRLMSYFYGKFLRNVLVALTLFPNQVPFQNIDI